MERPAVDAARAGHPVARRPGHVRHPVARGVDERRSLRGDGPRRVRRSGSGRHGHARRDPLARHARHTDGGHERGARHRRARDRTALPGPPALRSRPRPRLVVFVLPAGGPCRITAGRVRGDGRHHRALPRPAAPGPAGPSRQERGYDARLEPHGPRVRRRDDPVVRRRGHGGPAGDGAPRRSVAPRYRARRPDGAAVASRGAPRRRIRRLRRGPCPGRRTPGSRTGSAGRTAPHRRDRPGHRVLLLATPHQPLRRR